MHPRIALTITLVFATCAALALAPKGDTLKTHAIVTGTATRVHDGDTFWLELPTVAHKIRIHGADAPETQSKKWPEQPGAQAAKNWLEKTINGKQVMITVKGKSYDRFVCTVTFEGRDIGMELIEQGLAMCDSRYANRAQKLAEAEAKKAKRGVWADDKAIEPRLWRSGQRK